MALWMLLINIISYGCACMGLVAIEAIKWLFKKGIFASWWVITYVTYWNLWNYLLWSDSHHIAVVSYSYKVNNSVAKYLDNCRHQWCI